MIITNNNMKKYIDKVESVISEELEKLVNKMCMNIIEVNECIVLKRDNLNINISIDKIIDIYGDRTGYEVHCNEFLVREILPNKFYKSIRNDADKETVLGLEIAKILSDKLKIMYNKCTFYVIVSNDGNVTNIRFHKYRKGESWININELDNFKYEALAVIIN